MAAGAISILPVWARIELELPSLPITDRLVAVRSRAPPCEVCVG
jgi:hypothetical protein